MTITADTRPTVPSPAMLAARVAAEFEVQRILPLGDCETIAAGTRMLPPGQEALDRLVDALVREHRQSNLRIVAAATSLRDGQPLTSYAFGEPSPRRR